MAAYQSESRKRAVLPRRAAFSRASARQAGSLSTPRTVAAGRSTARARAMAPQPVPRSSIRVAVSARSSAASTTPSVSGRGTRARASTRNGRLQNSRSPKMYATGSPPRRRSTRAARQAPRAATMGRSGKACSVLRGTSSARAVRSSASKRGKTVRTASKHSPMVPKPAAITIPRRGPPAGRRGVRGPTVPPARPNRRPRSHPTDRAPS